MIAHAQIFAQQPRNSVSPILLTQCILYQTNIFFAQPNSVSIPYCQEAPKNPELNGLFQCQYIGSKSNTFVGGKQVGAPGTIPRNMAKPLDPLGSCPAHPQGPIADGSQLSDIVSTPFASGSSPAASDGTHDALPQSIQIRDFFQTQTQWFPMRLQPQALIPILPPSQSQAHLLQRLPLVVISDFKMVWTLRN